jgi:surface-anchored protein
MHSLRVLGLLLVVGAVEASPIFTEGHADIGVRLVDGRLQVGLNLLGATVDGTSLSGFVPLSSVTVFVPDSTLESRPANVPGSQNFDPIGILAGADMYRLSSSGTESFINEAPYLGFGSYLLSGSDFIGPVTFRLDDYWSQKGGRFSLFQFSNPGPKFLVTTADGVGPSDSFELGLGAHDHYNWVFTTDGPYRMTWSAEVTHRTLGRLTAAGVMSVGVTSTVPEASSAGLVLIGLCLAVGARRSGRVSRQRMRSSTAG